MKTNIKKLSTCGIAVMALLFFAQIACAQPQGEFQEDEGFRGQGEPQGQGYPQGQGGPQGPEGQQRGGHNKERKIEKMVEELGLTSEQQEKMREQRTDHREKMKGIMETLRAKKEELRSELEKQEIDRGKINGIVAEVKSLMGQQLDLRIEDTLAMKDILTPEQYQKFQEFIKKGPKKGKQKGFHKRGFGKNNRGSQQRGSENNGRGVQGNEDF